jgi:hypothetical protein
MTGRREFDNCEGFHTRRQAISVELLLGILTSAKLFGYLAVCWRRLYSMSAGEPLLKDSMGIPMSVTSLVERVHAPGM